MDVNSDSTETPKKPEEHHEHHAEHSQHNAVWASTPEAKKEEKAKPELKMPIDVSSFKMPSFKMPEGGISAYLKTKFAEYRRVYNITKKPDKAEYTATVKASGMGIIVIGVLGFLITMIVQLIQMAGK